jgi:hypothetical protein
MNDSSNFDLFSQKNNNDFSNCDLSLVNAKAKSS